MWVNQCFVPVHTCIKWLYWEVMGNIIINQQTRTVVGSPSRDNKLQVSRIMRNIQFASTKLWPIGKLLTANSTIQIFWWYTMKYWWVYIYPIWCIVHWPMSEFLMIDGLYILCMNRAWVERYNSIRRNQNFFIWISMGSVLRILIPYTI